MEQEKEAALRSIEGGGGGGEREGAVMNSELKK